VKNASIESPLFQLSLARVRVAQPQTLSATVMQAWSVAYGILLIVNGLCLSRRLSFSFEFQSRIALRVMRSRPYAASDVPSYAVDVYLATYISIVYSRAWGKRTPNKAIGSIFSFSQMILAVGCSQGRGHFVFL
jgi:hypothetical protein